MNQAVLRQTLATVLQIDVTALQFQVLQLGEQEQRSRNSAQDMVMLLPFWIVEKWEACDCLGKTQSRRVECSIDHVQSCLATGSKPPQERPCACQEPGPFLGLHDAALAILFGVLAAVALCCCACCILEIRRFCRNTTRRGRCRLLDSRNQFADFEIRDVGYEKKKVHIIWSLDDSIFEAYRAVEEDRVEQMN